MIIRELYDYLMDRFNKDERIMLFCLLSLFIPFYMCVICLLGVVIYLLYTKKLVASFKEIKGSKYLLLFSLLSAFTSLIHQNWIGLIATIAIVVIFCIIVYYMTVANKEFFELCVDFLIFMSILAALYGLVEYISILNKMDINTFEIIVFNQREDRVNSVFFNANYYAMMIEFFVLMCFYKAFNLKLVLADIKKILYYSIVILLNLFLLYLTGCRSAWPALAIGIFVLLYFNHHYKSVTILTIVVAIMVIGILFFPNIFPRVDNIISYFFTRQNIWATAIEALKDNWLIGQGPLTYFHVSASYGGYVTHHAHSVYIDPFLSHGVIGVALLVPYGYHCIKGCFGVAKAKVDRSYLALVLSFVFIVLIHGLFDLTIYFVQTSFVFLFIASSFYMYKDYLPA